MERRNFIRTTGLAAAGVFIAPYILPSGRLFAATGARKANHVVFCLFAGGVRTTESIDKADGNLMPNTLTGSESISGDIMGSMSQLPTPLSSPLQNFGTLYKQFRYAQGPTGHFNGHTTAITGAYTTTDLNIKMPPQHPTVFEYYRKHNSPVNSALNSWWISNSLGPYPSLNYSVYPEYGALYGANYIQPASLISTNGHESLGNPKVFSSDQLSKIADMRSFLDNNFKKSITSGDAGVTNAETDAIALESFIQTSFNEAMSGQYTNPWNLAPGVMSGDMFNIFFAEKVLQQFKPELLVVNMQDVDIAHSNFSQYCNNLRKADYALAHLWNTIQNTPGLANDTILIAVPEHGRNASPNTLMDSNGRYALDHTSDAKSREIFCLVLGPPSVIKQNQEITAITGESIDIVPTIANILGFDAEIPGGMLNGNVLNDAFV